MDVGVRHDHAAESLGILELDRAGHVAQVDGALHVHLGLWIGHGRAERQGGVEGLAVDLDVKRGQRDHRAVDIATRVGDREVGRDRFCGQRQVRVAECTVDDVDVELKRGERGRSQCALNTSIQ